MPKNDAKNTEAKSVEEKMAESFSRAAKRVGRDLSKLVSYERKVVEDYKGDFDFSTPAPKAAETDQDMIEGRNGTLQGVLMEHEKEHGKVDQNRRPYASKAEQSLRVALQEKLGSPHHPLLKTQRFDGMMPSDSPEATVNPEAAEQLDDYLESHPELVNSPQLRAAFELRKQMKAQMTNAARQTLHR